MMIRDIDVETPTGSGGSIKPHVRRRTANQHAINIIRQLHYRPIMNDADGYYDFLKDEEQMVQIVENYIKRFFA